MVKIVVPPLRALSPATLALFLEYLWPGYVRELENLVRRFVLLQAKDVEIRAEVQTAMAAAGRNGDGPPHPKQEPLPPFNLRQIACPAAREAERGLIQRALESTHWNRAKAAKLLGISYRGLL